MQFSVASGALCSSSYDHVLSAAPWSFDWHSQLSVGWVTGDVIFYTILFLHRAHLYASWTNLMFFSKDFALL
jgi:hypothetical protein